MNNKNKNILNSLKICFILFNLSFIPSTALASDPSLGNPEGIAQLVQAYYKYAIGAVGIVATATMVFGGLLWIMAAGNPSRVENAKTWVTSALTGFVLALFSYTLLYFINPNLVSFRNVTITPPAINTKAAGRDKVSLLAGCCQLPKENTCNDSLTIQQCKNEKEGVAKGSAFFCNKQAQICQQKGRKDEYCNKYEPCEYFLKCVDNYCVEKLVNCKWQEYCWKSKTPPEIQVEDGKCPKKIDPNDPSVCCCQSK